MIRDIFNKIFKSKATSVSEKPQARSIARGDHGISRKHISHNAVKVLYRLHNAGYAAYLVGGGVRDLLLNKSPKDFDVATDAKPEDIKKLFRNCLLIGRRFRIAHIRFGQEIIEVTTFRSNQGGGKQDRLHSKLGMLLKDNVYGNINDDALRRDFTVNALYYNIADFTVLDFTSGIDDLKSKTLRLIGKPVKRYQEDPVRMLRAIRFAGKLGFTLHPDTEKPIKKSARFLKEVAPARLFDEFLKLFFSGHAQVTFTLLRKHDVFKWLLPEQHLAASTGMQLFIEKALANTDQRIKEDLSVNPGFLIAVFLWPQFLAEREALRGKKRLTPQAAEQKAMSAVLNQNNLPMSVPKRLGFVIRDIWSLQWRMSTQKQHHAVFVAEHARFRAAYDFFILRALCEPDLNKQAQWWTDFQAAEHDTQQEMLKKLQKAKRRRYKKPRQSAQKPQQSHV